MEEIKKIITEIIEELKAENIEVTENAIITILSERVTAEEINKAINENPEVFYKFLLTLFEIEEEEATDAEQALREAIEGGN